MVFVDCLEQLCYLEDSKNRMLHHKISITRKDLKQRKERIEELVKQKFEREKEYRLKKYGERHSVANIDVFFAYSGYPTLYLFVDVEREESDFEFRERTDIRYRTLKTGEVLVLERSRDLEKQVVTVEVFKSFNASSHFVRGEVALFNENTDMIDSQEVDGFHLFICNEKDLHEIEGERYEKDTRIVKEENKKKNKNSPSIWNRVKGWWHTLKYKKERFCEKALVWLKQWLPDSWASVEVIPVLRRFTIYQRDGEIREVTHALPWKTVSNNLTAKR